MNGGTVEVQNVYPCHLIPVIAKLRKPVYAGNRDDSIILKAPHV